MKKETQVCFLIDFFFILSIASILYLLVILLPSFTPFLFAYFLSLIFIKLSGQIKERFKIKSKLATVISAVLFYLFVSVFIWIIATSAAEGVIKFSKDLPDIFKNSISPALKSFENFYLRIFPERGEIYKGEMAEIFADSSSEIIKDISQKMLSLALNFIENIPLFLAGFIFTILSSFYIGIDYEAIKEFFKRLIPKDFHFFFKEMNTFFSQCLGKIVRSYAILMIITFSELFLGLKLLKIENSAKIALLTSLLDILPLLGTGCVLIPWGLFCLLTENYTKGWGLIILWAVITVVRNITEPHLIGKNLGLSPLLSLIACFTGLKFMGLKGMILFPVAFLAVKYIFGTGKLNTT